MRRPRAFALGSAFLFLLLGVVLAPSYMYHLNPDGVTYIALAEKYLAGDLKHALSDYWSPLFPWLLLPFIASGVDPLLAAKFVNILAGLLLFLSVYYLSRAFELREDVEAALYVILLPLSLYFAFFVITPDLLLTSLLLLLFAFLFSPLYPKKPWYAVACGVLGGFSYLAKSFAFPFFLTLFTLSHLLWGTLEKGRGGSIKHHFLLGLLAFALCILPWLLVLNQGRETWTIGNSGAFIHAMEGPDARGIPMLEGGLFAPSDPRAVSIWDYPPSMEATEWSLFQSLRHFRWQLRLILQNSLKALQAFLAFSPLSYAVIAVTIVLAVSARGGRRRTVWFPLLAIALFLAAYLPVLVDPRYFWPLFVLLLPMGGEILSMFFAQRFFTAPRRILALALFALSFLVTPFIFLVDAASDGRELAESSRMLRESLEIEGKNVAADTWKLGLFASYYADSKYYGTPRMQGGDRAIERQLLRDHIDYYLVWREGPKLREYREIARGEEYGFRVYIRKK